MHRLSVDSAYFCELSSDALAGKEQLRQSARSCIAVQYG